MVTQNQESVVLFWVPTLKEAVPPPQPPTLEVCSPEVSCSGSQKVLLARTAVAATDLYAYFMSFDCFFPLVLLEVRSIPFQYSLLIVKGDKGPSI